MGNTASDLALTAPVQSRWHTEQRRATRRSLGASVDLKKILHIRCRIFLISKELLLYCTLCDTLKKSPFCEVLVSDSQISLFRSRLAQFIFAAFVSLLMWYALLEMRFTQPRWTFAAWLGTWIIIMLAGATTSALLELSDPPFTNFNMSPAISPAIMMFATLWPHGDLYNAITAACLAATAAAVMALAAFFFGELYTKCWLPNQTSMRRGDAVYFCTLCLLAGYAIVTALTYSTMTIVTIAVFLAASVKEFKLILPLEKQLAK